MGDKISGFTKEESEIYKKAIEELFKKTGRNLFDLKETSLIKY